MTADAPLILTTYVRSRFRPVVGLALNAIIAAVLLPGVVDQSRFRMWLAVGGLLAVLFLIDGLRDDYGTQRSWNGLPPKVYLIGASSGCWVGLLTVIDPAATRVAEVAYVIVLIAFGTVLRLMLYGSMGLLRMVWLLSTLASTAIGLAIAGQWVLVLVLLLIGLAARQISLDSDAIFDEVEQLRAESQTRAAVATRDAEIDPLTGLLNRRGLEGRLGEFAVGHCLFVDLDHFKMVNDGYGHDVGDDVLRAVGRRLGETVAGSGVSGRLGGDEFVVLVDRETDAAALGAQVLHAIRQPIDIADGSSVAISASAGCVPVTDGDALRMMIRRSDAALYMAKESGRGRLVTGSD